MIRQNPKYFFVAILIFGMVEATQAQMAGYPAPRYPKIPNITSVEQLMPYARYIVSKPGDKTIVMRPGYSIQGGERVLIRVSDDNDPLVIEAFRRAFVEKDCTVDILILPTTDLAMGAPTDGANELKFSRWAGLDIDLAMSRVGSDISADTSIDAFIQSRKYDLVIGATTSVGDGKEYLAERMRWFTREMLASPATTFPEEVVNLLDRKGWEIIRTAKSARVTSPEGTDISWTWWPGYWQVAEGTHPEIKMMGGGPRSGQSGYIYGPGRSEDPLIPGHLMGVAEGIVLPESDGEGVVAGTMNGSGPFKRMEIHVKNHQVSEVKGDDEYATLFRRVMDRFKNIKYPLYPRQGYGFLVECAIGTNPKVSLPYNVMETIKMKPPFVSKFSPSAAKANLYTPGSWSEERRRTGVIHWGFGIISAENEEWGLKNDAPVYHYHLHQWFATYEATMPDGSKKLVIDKGRLTALD
ncbi:MAG: hypothetical protein HYX73_07020, partial [Acidobacteria bacterium]|nr:hypothetical protein [Acidobacteriota bacterium]